EVARPLLLALLRLRAPVVPVADGAVRLEVLGVPRLRGGGGGDGEREERGSGETKRTRRHSTLLRREVYDAAGTASAASRQAATVASARLQISCLRCARSFEDGTSESSMIPKLTFAGSKRRSFLSDTWRESEPSAVEKGSGRGSRPSRSC